MHGLPVCPWTPGKNHWPSVTVLHVWRISPSFGVCFYCVYLTGRTLRHPVRRCKGSTPWHLTLIVPDSADTRQVWRHAEAARDHYSGCMSKSNNRSWQRHNMNARHSKLLRPPVQPLLLFRESRYHTSVILRWDVSEKIFKVTLHSRSEAKHVHYPSIITTTTHTK